MPSDAPQTAPDRRPRKWRNRRPADRRIDLNPAEADQAADRKRLGQRKAFIGAFVTDSEKEKIAARARRSGMKQSDFIRTVLLSDVKEPPAPRIDPEAVRALAFQLSKLGTNLNQLARIANETHQLDFGTELRALSAQIAGSLARVIEL